MATLLRALWSIALGFVVGYFVPSPWCWIWIGAIVLAWLALLVLAAYQLGIRNGWPLRRL